VPFNVLLLPLLGGYIFLTLCNRTQFETKRHSGERLVFHAAIVGVFLLAGSFLVVGAISAACPALARWWHAVVPFAYSGVAFGAFSLGWILPGIVNFACFPRDSQIRRAIREAGDDLEMLLLETMDREVSVLVTLSSAKVYIGRVTRSVDPSQERRYVSLLPMLSGYRNSEDQEFIPTNDYLSLYEDVISGRVAGLNVGADEFQVVIPVSEIVSVSPFAPVIYDELHPTQSVGDSHTLK
jgi:hypothetical protein